MEANRDLLARRLERKGYRVVAVASGVEALAAIDAEHIDLVLLDVMMPEMDGLETLARLRAAYPAAALPVIMATARADALDVVDALDRGASDYVTKPIDVNVLLARVRVHLRGKRPRVTEPPPDPSSVCAGAVIADKYRLLEPLGAGGFGVVWRAHHLSLQVDVAVKLMHGHLLGSRDTLRRFELEGISSCRVRHPNAVAMLDAGTTPSGVPYLVMELLSGRSLSQELSARGSLSLARTAQIALPVCDVLLTAHALGILHRDIKPANILLHQSVAGEVVKVLDFGIAKLVDASRTQRGSTEGLVGTPQYMAPERLLGMNVDERSDAFSLGTMIFEMVAGRGTFEQVDTNPIAQALHQLGHEPRDVRDAVPGLPADVAAMIMASLARDAHYRATIADIRAVLAPHAEAKAPEGALVLAGAPATADAATAPMPSIPLASGVIRREGSPDADEPDAASPRSRSG
jgi:serine/threonine protein kinase/CheY-like chemotaxis protein